MSIQFLKKLNEGWIVLFKKSPELLDTIIGNKYAARYVYLVEMREMKRKNTILFSAFVLLFCCVIPSSAQSASQSFSLILSGGLLSDMTFGKLNPLPNTADVPEITVLLENRCPSFGLSLGYLITERIEFQGTVTYGRSEIIDDVGIGLAGIPLGKIKISDVKNITCGGNLLYYFFLRRISLFLTGGVGAVTLMTSELGSSTKLFLDFGAGIRLNLTKHVSAFLDLKDHLSFFNYPRDFDVFFVAIYDPEFSKSQHRPGICLSLAYTI